MNVRGQVLLINPWIYDFAAHNLWIEPLGMLTIAAALRDSGYGVTVIDCLAPHEGAPPPRPDGSGKFQKRSIPRPEPVAFVPRRFGRYGISAERFESALSAAPAPDLVMVASGMTYWYPGVVEIIKRVRASFGTIPVALGGIYATLCPEHALRRSGADRILAGPGLAAALRLADEVTGSDSDPDRYAGPRAWPAPAHDLVPRPFAGIVTSWGCPFHCTYCAGRRLQPAFVQQEPRSVVDEIVECARRGIQDFAFYDDALLVNAKRHIVSILEGILAEGVLARFHTPNGIHASEIDAKLAILMYQAGFSTVRLSLETTDTARQETTGGKVTTAAFERAVAHLQAAGFRSGELAAYILAGLPGQPLAEVEDSIRFVHGLGVQAKLALFSPIPGTPDGDRALPATADPLLHNNTVYPYLLGDAHVSRLQDVKLLAKEGNAALAAR